jgi:hypothetical protein
MAANRAYVWKFQTWKSKHDKFDLVTADLKQGTSKLPYPAAAAVLKAIIDLFTIVANQGPLSFKHSYKFTRNDRLVTSLGEIAGKVASITGKKLSHRVIQKALLLMHQDGMIYKTKGYNGNVKVCRLFIDLKGFRLCGKLDAAIAGCLERHAIVVQRFPLAEEGEYGFGRKMALPNPPDGAEYINGYNVPGAIGAEQTSALTVRDNTPSQIIPLKAENEPLARPPFNLEEPGEINEVNPITAAQWVEFRLAPQMQKIIEFIQTHEVFTNEEYQHRPLERITAQEAASLIRCVQSAGLTLAFLKRYARLIVSHVGDEWFMNCRLGFFCDHFFIIKKFFYRLEAEENLDLLCLPPGGKIIDIVRNAENFAHNALFCLAVFEDPSVYRDVLALNPHQVEDGGENSACVILQAMSLPNIVPEDRDFIIAEHRDMARLWFLNNPSIYFGLKQLGYAIDKALQIEDEDKMREVLEKQYVSLKTYVDRYRDQMSMANQDFCAIEKYQEVQ